MRWPTLLRVFGLVKGRLPLYLGTLLFSALTGSAMQVLTGLMLRTMFDSVVAKDLAGLVRGVTLYGGALVTFLAARIVSGLIYQSTVAAMTGDLRKKVFAHVQRLPMAYYDKVHGGDLVSRLTNDLAVLEPAYASVPATFIGQVAGGLGGLGFVASVDWRLALYMVAAGILGTLPGVLSAASLRRIGRDIQRGIAKGTEKVSDLLSGAGVVRVYGLAGPVMEDYRRENQVALSASIRQVRRQAIVNALTGLPIWTGQLGLLGLGVFLAIRQSITIGSVVAALGVYGSVVGLFQPFSTTLTRLQESLAGGDRLLEILDTKLEPGPDRVQADTCPTGFLEFRNVTFSYESGLSGGDSRRVLDRVSFRIEKGERVALVGPSGSGKTTIINLILGFYVPQEGSISVGGLRLGEKSLDEIRKLVAYVPQDAHLFAATVADNIRYGRPDATTDEIIRAAQAANAHDFIVKFPSGYDTLVGERGAQVSGGQRQRIAIARAILKDAPILLLDEATSSLDSESERLVQDALEKFMAKRTTLVIAHRLSTVMNADRILVLDRGRIVQSGTHGELLADEAGLYRRLYETQLIKPSGNG